MIGKVKWFDVQKGYGIICSEMGQEFLVHERDARCDLGFLLDAELVQFQRKKNPQGQTPYAVNVEPFIYEEQ